MSALLGSIGRACIFAVCAETLIQFRARDSYGKYLKLLVGLMILSLLMEPFCELLVQNLGLSIQDRVNAYWEEFEEEYSKMPFVTSIDGETEVTDGRSDRE